MKHTRLWLTMFFLAFIGRANAAARTALPEKALLPAAQQRTLKIGPCKSVLAGLRAGNRHSVREFRFALPSEREVSVNVHDFYLEGERDSINGATSNDADLREQWQCRPRRNHATSLAIVSRPQVGRKK